MNKSIKTFFIGGIAGVSLFLASCNEQKSQNQKTNNMETSVPKISDFPLGEENTGYAQYFSGKSWLAPLTRIRACLKFIQ